MSPLPCARHNAHTHTRSQAGKQHCSPNSLGSRSLSSLSLSQFVLLSCYSARSQWFVLRSVALRTREHGSSWCDVVGCGLSWLWRWRWLWLPGLRQTCLLAKMVCLASLVVAFVAVAAAVGNHKNLAAHSTLDWADSRQAGSCGVRVSWRKWSSIHYSPWILQDFCCCTLWKSRKRV